MRTAAAALVIPLLTACQFDVSGLDKGRTRSGVDAGPVEGSDARPGPGRDATPGPSPDAPPAPIDAAPVAIDAPTAPDAAQSLPPDATTELLPYGASCRFSAECETEMCANVRGSQVCTLQCPADDDCPGDDDCVGNRCDPTGGGG